ncbi:MAG TPA: dTMP kinase [Acidimicrobiales bacterium]|nr:dTMP kinase [Acidimicrobiales bacterium]
MRGRLIAFEGGEGSGKSTQAALLAERLGARLTREPGGTPLGEKIRSVVLDPSSGVVDARAEALLMAAARAQHVAEVIEPALARGETVVTDRYIGSSLAYQGHGHGLSVEELVQLSHWATDGRPADVSVLLTVPADVAAERMRRPVDRMERLGKKFHRRVNEGFVALASAAPDHWVVVDGVGSIEEVAQRVNDAYDAWVKAQ